MQFVFMGGISAFESTSCVRVLGGRKAGKGWFFWL